jgi:hypothetical protein
MVGDRFLFKKFRVGGHHLFYLGSSLGSGYGLVGQTTALRAKGRDGSNLLTANKY